MVASVAEAGSHNVPPALIQSYWRKIREAKRAQDDANAAMARVKKDAKNGGLEMKSIKLLETLSREDDDVLEVVLGKAIDYAKVLGMAFAKQLSLFAGERTEPDVSHAEMEKHKEWEAGEAGLRAGRDGDAASANPYPLGSPGYVAWAKQHTAGLTERATAARSLNTEAERVADNATATKKAAQGRKPRSTTKASTALGNARAHLGSALN